MKRVLVALLAIAAAPVLAQLVSFDFMPDGGRNLLIPTLGSPAALEAALSASAHRGGMGRLSRRNRPVARREAAETLAGYLAVNMPLAAERQAKVIASRAAADLPPDGKDLAIANCQFCHSFFTGYLAHERDVAGWRSVFKAPFHAELPMTEAERETFARYSAINMPIPFEDVPEDPALLTHEGDDHEVPAPVPRHRRGRRPRGPPCAGRALRLHSRRRPDSARTAHRGRRRSGRSRRPPGAVGQGGGLERPPRPRGDPCAGRPRRDPDGNARRLPGRDHAHARPIPVR